MRDRLPKDSGETGCVAIEGLLGLAMLLLVGVVALSLPTWAHRQAIGRSMAREAAREFVLAPNWEIGETRALRVATETAENRGLGDDRWRVVEIRCEGDGGEDCRQSEVIPRGGKVTVVLELTVPFLAIVRYGGGARYGGGYHWTVSHTEVRDPYGSWSR